ncbi:hypothetical protein FGO68_gene11161 [Halteria grandinella]|uniref:Uncharacterized protein n=1 Tax=Halteria grandinella TaxID=5974 RepID=A0A8J8NS85_HALGN|nr:hypothetical protein FGO68_gene11161 [Halteria grandinella]
MEMNDHQQPQSKNKATTLESIAQQQEYMELCSCGSEEKVMLQCEEETCPNYEKQKLYCPNVLPSQSILTLLPSLLMKLRM